MTLKSFGRNNSIQKTLYQTDVNDVLDQKTINTIYSIYNKQ
jgi:hypothetical protein